MIPGNHLQAWQSMMQPNKISHVSLIFRIRYSSMPPPNHKLPLDLDLDGIVKELTIGDQGYVLIPGIFTKEEVDMARFVLFKQHPILILKTNITFYKPQGNLALLDRD